MRRDFTLGALSLVLTISACTDDTTVRAASVAAGTRVPMLEGRFTDPGLPGPFAVGFEFIRYLDTSRNVESGGRHVPVHVFYPVDAADVGADAALATYPLDPLYGLRPEVSSSEFEALGVQRAYAAPPPSSKGPFPLVVFSPGWGNEATFYLFVGTRLASHGFVVAVLTHQGDAASPVPTADTMDHIALVMLNRPRDVSFAITRLLEENDSSSSVLHRTVEPTRIAAAGHSLGGYAALVLGGAGDDAICDSVAMDSEWMGPPPAEACGTSVADPRVRAVFYLDASNQFLRFAELARIRLPIQGVGQDPDSLNAVPPPWGSWQARIHAAVASEHAYRADVKHAIHLSFTNFCQVFPVYLQNSVIDQATFDFATGLICGDTSPILNGGPLIPQLEAQRLAMKMGIPFLKTSLAGDTRYKHMVDAHWVNRLETNVAFFETEEGGTTHEGPGAAYLDPSWTDEFDYFVYPPTNPK